eukprot:3705691-Pleurochrysis_carterae.AAC.7
MSACTRAAIFSTPCSPPLSALALPYAHGRSLAVSSCWLLAALTHASIHSCMNTRTHAHTHARMALLQVYAKSCPAWPVAASLVQDVAASPRLDARPSCFVASRFASPRCLRRLALRRDADAAARDAPRPHPPLRPVRAHS